MARHLKITIASIASILALAIAGCSGDEEPTTVAPIPETAKNDQGKTEQFKNPVVPPKQPTTSTAPSTLIQPTDPTERIGVVAKGRKDPFDEIIPPIKFATKKPEDSGSTAVNKPKRAVPNLPPLPAASGRRTASRGGSSGVTVRPRRVAVRPRRSAVISATTGGRNSTNSNPGQTNTKKKQSTGNKPGSSGGIATNNVPAKIPVLPQQMPGVVPPPELAPVLPPPPEPKLAQAVLVSGVIQVGNQPQAIIKVPSEPTSRYVQAGTKISKWTTC